MALTLLNVGLTFKTHEESLQGLTSSISIEPQRALVSHFYDGFGYTEWLKLIGEVQSLLREAQEKKRQQAA